MNHTVAGCVCGVEPSGRDLGIEVQGVYDGILIWECGSCRRLRPRASGGKLHQMAQEIISKWAEEA